MDDNQETGVSEESASEAETSSNIDPKVAAVLAYFFGWIGGLVFYLIESKNKFIRFHALQSILLSVVVFAVFFSLGIVLSFIAFVPGLSLVAVTLGPLLYFVAWTGFIVLWVLLMVRAYEGEKWKLPIIGDIAEKNA